MSCNLNSLVREGLNENGTLVPSPEEGEGVSKGHLWESLTGLQSSHCKGPESTWCGEEQEMKSEVEGRGTDYVEHLSSPDLTGFLWLLC